MQICWLVRASFVVLAPVLWPLALTEKVERGRVKARPSDRLAQDSDPRFPTCCRVALGMLPRLSEPRSPVSKRETGPPWVAFASSRGEEASVWPPPCCKDPTTVIVFVAPSVSFRKRSTGTRSQRWSFSAVGKRKTRRSRLCFPAFIPRG